MQKRNPVIKSGWANFLKLEMNTYTVSYHTTPLHFYKFQNAKGVSLIYILINKKNCHQYKALINPALSWNWHAVYSEESSLLTR